MRIAFAGTPPFAATGLMALLDAGFEVGTVLSQPDRPAGRGQQLQASAVKRLAQQRGIAVLTPSSLRADRASDEDRRALERLRVAAPDLLVVAAYGLLLPLPVLQLPRGVTACGGELVQAINIHASLLPRWRGAAPIVRAIEAGDERTGITIMQMDAGLDTGPILLSEAFDIDPEASAGALTEELARLGGRLVVQAVRELAAGRLQPRAQPDMGVVYARKVEKAEAWIDWRQPAERLAARIRAFDPYPGACSSINGHTVKVWRARVAQAVPAGAGAAPGTVLASNASGICVACASGCLLLTQLQRPGGRRLEAHDFLGGMDILPGALWGTPAGPTHGA